MVYLTNKEAYAMCYTVITHDGHLRAQGKFLECITAYIINSYLSPQLKYMICLHPSPSAGILRTHKVTSPQMA